jgi:hypothetical protein
MAWGYRLEVLSARDGARCRDNGRGCSVSRCGESPQFMSAYRYARSSGAAVTTSRPLCVGHARLFSMKHSLAWPAMLLRRTRRSITVAWNQMAA